MRCQSDAHSYSYSDCDGDTEHGIDRYSNTHGNSYRDSYSDGHSYDNSNFNAYV